MGVYVLAIDGKVEKYPYTLTDMRLANTDISFPRDIPDEMAATFNTFPVVEVIAPTYNPDTQTLVWVNPTYANGIWTQQWRVDDLTPEEIAERLADWRQSTSCTPFQGKVALHNADLLSQVESLIDNPQTDPVTKLAWNNAVEWKRNSPMIASLASSLGLSDEQVDNLFKAAQNIQA